jgi:hypothetical protein
MKSTEDNEELWAFVPCEVEDNMVVDIAFTNRRVGKEITGVFSDNHE